MDFQVINEDHLDKIFTYFPLGIRNNFPKARTLNELLDITPSQIATDISFSGETQQYLIRFASIPPLDIRNIKSTALFCTGAGQMAYFSAINPRKNTSPEYPIGFATAGLLDEQTAYLQTSQGISVSQSQKISGIYPKSGVVLYCRALVERLANAGIKEFLMFEPKAYASCNVYRRADDHGRWGWRPEVDDVMVKNQRTKIRANYERIARKIGGEVTQIELPYKITSTLSFAPSLTVRKKRLAA